MRTEIAELIKNCVDSTLARISGEERTLRPFHVALLTEDIVSASSFERSFSSSFGQGAIEQISMLIAIDAGYDAARGRSFRITISEDQERLINEILSGLRDGKNPRKTNWNKELRELASAAGGNSIDMNLTVDLWIGKGERDCYYTLKTVKPNIDQTGEAKRLLLRLKANDPSCETYFSLYYNPYGEDQSDYNWTPPCGIFNMREDECVLIGRDYWDNIGGEGTYFELLEVFREVGEYTQKRLQL